MKNNVSVPSNVSLAQDFYQNTPVASLTGPVESQINLWGETPGQIDVEDPGVQIQGIPLTNQKLKNGNTIGHSEVVDYYMQIVEVDGLTVPDVPKKEGTFPYPLFAANLMPFTANATNADTFTTDAKNAGAAAGVYPLPGGDPLVVTSQPPVHITAGNPFSLVIKAEFDDGQVNGKFNGPITISLVETTHSPVVLKGVLTVTAVNGVAIFAGLTVNQPANSLQIIVTTPTLPAVLSHPFNVVAAAPPLPPSSRQEAVQVAHLTDPDSDFRHRGGGTKMASFFVAADVPQRAIDEGEIDPVGANSMPANLAPGQRDHSTDGRQGVVIDAAQTGPGSAPISTRLYAWVGLIVWVGGMLAGLTDDSPEQGLRRSEKQQSKGEEPETP